MRPTTIDAVLERVTPEPNTGCLLWMGGADRDGYGLAKIRGVSYRVHRLAWERANGPIPPGLLVCHRCDNPACVLSEPGGRGHLFLGTNLDNVHDRDAKGRGDAGRGDNHYSRRYPELRPRGERHGRRRLTEAQAREIIARLHAGETQHGLARVFGVSVATVNLIALGRNWAHLPRPAGPPAPLRISYARGESQPNAKLTEERVREMRARHAAGESRYSIAHAFGISQGVAKRILRREAWAHVA